MYVCVLFFSPSSLVSMRFVYARQQKKNGDLKGWCCYCFCFNIFVEHLLLVSLHDELMYTFISFDVLLFVIFLSCCFNLIGWLHDCFFVSLFVCLLIWCRCHTKQQRAIKTVAMAILVAPIKPYILNEVANVLPFDCYYQ